MEDLKEQVAQCCRLLQMAGLVQQSGHISARIPGTDRVLIHPKDVSRSEVTAKHILTVDLGGNLVEGDDTPPAETYIHTCIYRARGDVLSVAHLHSHYATLLSITDKKLLPICTAAIPFAEGVPVYPSSLLVDSVERGEGVARALGRARAVLLQGHGSVVVGLNIGEVFADSLRLEEAAQMQCEATLLGGVKLLSQSDITQSHLSPTGQRSAHRKVWDYYMSLARKQGLW